MSNTSSTIAASPTVVSDMAMGSAPPKPAEEKKPEEKKPDAPANDNGEPGKPPEPKPAEAAAPNEPSKLERARAVARAKHLQFQERQNLLESTRRSVDAANQARAFAGQERARAEAAQRELDAIKADPMAALAYLEKAGLPAKVLAQKAVEASTPEAKLRAELEAKLAASVAEIREQYTAELKKRDGERDAAARAAQMVAARQHFINEASDAAQFPAVAHLVALGDKWKASLVEEASRVLHEAYQRTGQEYTNREVLSFLNEKYAELITPTQPKTESTKSEVGREPTKEVLPNGTGAEEKSAAGTPRTLTNKAAQVKGSLPADFDSLSDRDQKAVLAAIYRQTSRG